MKGGSRRSQGASTSRWTSALRSEGTWRRRHIDTRRWSFDFDPATFLVTICLWSVLVPFHHNTINGLFFTWIVRTRRSEFLCPFISGCAGRRGSLFGRFVFFKLGPVALYTSIVTRLGTTIEMTILIAAIKTPRERPVNGVRLVTHSQKPRQRDGSKSFVPLSCIVQCVVLLSGI